MAPFLTLLPLRPPRCRWMGSGGCDQSVTLSLPLLPLYVVPLLHHGSFVQGAVLQEQTVPACVRYGVTSPARSLLLRGVFMGCGCLQGVSTCSRVGSSTGCSVDYLLHCSPPWAVGGLSSSPGSSPGAAGESLLCSGVWSIFPSPSFSNLQGCFSHVFLTPLTAALQHFLPFLKSIFTETPPAWLKGSAVSCGGSVLELAGKVCVWHWAAAPGVFSQRPPCSTPCYQNLAT